GRWVADTTRPACTWTADRTAGVGGWCAARFTALRVRVTGHGGPAPVGPYAVPSVSSVPAPMPPEMAPPDGRASSGEGAQVLAFPSPWARPDDHPHQDQDRDEQDRDERNGPHAGRPGGA
ncbi:MAG: hypothetical protein ACRDRK_27600, partial [Pseudonocardia sp.]